MGKPKNTTKPEDIKTNPSVKEAALTDETTVITPPDSTISDNTAPTITPDELVNQIQEINLEGKILGIGANATIWKSTSGRIELNRFAGLLSVKLPSGLESSEIMEITRGMEAGRVEIVEEVVTIEPVNPSYNDLSNLHSVNLFLDEKKLSVFEANVKKTPSKQFLSLCLSTEEADRNRSEYKSILKEKLKSIS